MLVGVSESARVVSSRVVVPVRENSSPPLEDIFLMSRSPINTCVKAPRPGLKYKFPSS